MNAQIRKYADSIYEDLLMESSKVLREGLIQSNRPGLGSPPISALISQRVKHVERCISARLESFKRAFADANTVPTEADFTEILNAFKTVYEKESKTNTAAVTRNHRVGSIPPGPRISETQIATQAAHGHDKTLREWKIWRDHSRLPKSDIAKPDEVRMKKNQTYRTTFNEYTVGQPIGNGGSGIVYEAINKDSERFALKVIDPKHVTTQKLKRFQNEIRFSENINHRNVIKVVDHGPGESGAPFYVMPLFECTLEKVMSEHIPPNAVLPIFSQLLDGVEAAHLKSVTHRDLKPKNILCDKEWSTFVVADFGIASFEDEELYTAVETRDGDRLANFYYAAPEQKVRGAVVGPAADIFALGLILNEMFTHSIPQGTNFKTVSSIAPEFSFLDRLIDEMARNEPGERPDIRTVKQQLIAYQQQFVSHQKINQLTNQVVNEESIDDDILIREPIIVVRAQFEPPRELHVHVNHPPNMTWQQEFFKQGNYTGFVDGPRPASVAFYGTRALVHGVSPDTAQMQLDYFKQWVQNANNLCRAKVELDARNRAASERKAIEQNLATEKLRQDVTSKLKW